MTTHWQVRRCIKKLQAVQGRKFPVPNPPEVFEAIRQIEVGNKVRSKYFERAVKNKIPKENLAQYQAIVSELSDAGVVELFERTLELARGFDQEALKLTWDMTVASLQRNAYSDILFDPEGNQFAARGLRCWVIKAHGQNLAKAAS